MKHRKSRANSGQKKKPGCLIIIGGREDRTGEMTILKEVAHRAKRSPIVIVTVASELYDDLWADYARVFKQLGVTDSRHLRFDWSEGRRADSHLEIFDRVKTVFFCGGDQLKITTHLGGTAIAKKIEMIYRTGGTIAGTSAGASAMGETMLVGADSHESHKVGNWMMSPGLGLISNMIIDQHFAQRARIGRLLGAVALNPVTLGVGIDENTAISVENGVIKVLGENAVYIIDGRSVNYTNISEAAAKKTMSMHNIHLHVLSDGDEFDIARRIPKAAVYASKAI